MKIMPVCHIGRPELKKCVMQRGLQKKMRIVECYDIVDDFSAAISWTLNYSHNRSTIVMPLPMASDPPLKSFSTGAATLVKLELNT